ncbi:RNA-binding S4 domain-containing protein [Aureibacillus halotolerans]|uniref:S4 domain protein YaaA n=1 Tax=Aureibacillus halotolerans TaxID=1508390 RepID=A0A4R6TWU4_9BACI|nr:RNA-binding S4 domain-containing protein [Aureibacillus halotolerans]TDQ38338.1 S4 domain protein YaaA [Aureibacillus halotolerans]
MKNEEIVIDTPYITLQQALQLTGEISTGGMAKMYLSEYTVLVNGEVDERRGRKLYPGDQLTLPEGGTYLISSR